MNVKDVTEVTIEPGLDMLVAIFQKQRDLMEKYHHIELKNNPAMCQDVPVDIHSTAGQARLKDFAWRITEELGEAMNTLKNKPWKQSHMLTDVAHYREEISDSFHFFVELCILSGIGPYDLYEMYFKKNEVNKFRQRSNY